MMLTLKTQIRWFSHIQQVIVASVLVTAAGFYVLAYRPETNRLQSLDGRIWQNERELTSAQSQARVLPLVQADINRLNATLADFKKLPANPGDLGQFEVELATLARRDNLRGLSINWQGTPGRDEQFYELPISVKFGGDFRDVFSFLCQMEDLSRLTRVKKMAIKSVGDNGVVQAEMTLNLYYSQG
jgi:Tfp pilus assembly protein PilO